MTALEKIKFMNDNEIQNWLRIIDPEDLKRGISGINEEIRKCIYGNMSENAGKVLKEIVKNIKNQQGDNQKKIIQKLESALQGI